MQRGNAYTYVPDNSMPGIAFLNNGCAAIRQARGVVCPMGCMIKLVSCIAWHEVTAMHIFNELNASTSAGGRGGASLFNARLASSTAPML